MIFINIESINIIIDNDLYNLYIAQVPDNPDIGTNKQIITSSKLKTKINRDKTQYIINNDLYNLYISQDKNQI